MAVYDLFGVIWSDAPESWARTLDNADGDITIRIDSPGGDVFASFAIYNLMRDYPGGTITADVIGLAASGASIAAMGADRVIMRKASQMMIHNPISWMVGDFNDFERLGKELRDLAEQLVEIYVAKTGSLPQTMQSMLNDVTWMTPTQALEARFADEIEQDDKADIAAMDYKAMWEHMGIMNIAMKGLEKKKSDALNPKQKKGSSKMPEPKENTLTVEQANQLVLAEKEKFGQNYESEFQKKYGMTPKEAVEKAQSSDNKIAEIQIASEKDRVTAFCDKLAGQGLSKHVVDLYKTMRTEIAAHSSDKKLAFASNGATAEVSLAEYCDKFVEAVLVAAVENKLVVPAGEKAKVPEDPKPVAEMEELRMKWAHKIPKPEEGTEVDQSSIDETVLAYEFIEQSDNKMKFSDALNRAKAKLAEMKKAQ